MDKELSILNQPHRCRHLLSKGMYINVNMPPGEEVTGDGHLWCGMTQTGFGPDHGLCGRDECIGSSRKCFVPL